MTRSTRFWMLAALPLALVACAEEPEPVVEDAVVVAEPVPVDPMPATPMPAEGAAGMTTVALQAVGNSGVTGEMMLTPSGQQTQVMVSVMGAPGAGTHQGHIHQGTCDSPGSVVQPLQALEVTADGTGSVSTTVDIPPATVMNGQHIVVYHEAGGSPGAPIVCGAIPSATM